MCKAKRGKATGKYDARDERNSVGEMRWLINIFEYVLDSGHHIINFTSMDLNFASCVYIYISQSISFSLFLPRKLILWRFFVDLPSSFDTLKPSKCLQIEISIYILMWYRKCEHINERSFNIICACVRACV